MEIFIIGAIIVAIMAYVSTRVKRVAREAYEPENFENEYFTITKPDDFIIPIKDKSEFLFEAYSKDYGDDDLADKFNQCWAVVVEKNGNLAEEVLESERVEENVTIKTLTKVLTNQNKSFQLEISLLPEYEENYVDRIKLMLDSFSLK
jgi:hypothetical protein